MQALQQTEDFTHKQADGTYAGSALSSLAHPVVGVSGWKHFLFWLLPVKMPKMLSFVVVTSSGVQFVVFLAELPQRGSFVICRPLASIRSL